jgi:hypothetical protein
MAVLADNEPQTVHGSVFSDVNGNGDFDLEDSGIEGVLVILFEGDSDNVAAQMATAADGTYAFTGRKLSSYTVKVEVQVWYADTTDISVLVTADAALFPVVDFGKEPLQVGSIRGTVCNDVDRGRDCVLEGVEVVDIPLEGVTVTLYDLENTFLDDVETDENGAYAFTELYPGSYTVVETDLKEPIFYYSITSNTVVVNLPTNDSMDVVVDFLDFIPAEGEVPRIDLMLMKFFDIALLDFQALRAMEGWGYGNIAKAYFLAQFSETSLVEILGMRETMGWGNIMKAVLGRAGLKGYNLGLIVSGREVPQTTQNLIDGCELINSEEQAQELFSLGGSNGSIKKACKLAKEVDGATFETLVEALELLGDHNQKQVMEMLQGGATTQVNNDDNGNHGPPACKGKNKNDVGCSKK